MKDTDCLIPLTQGKFAIVSPEDYDFISQFKWYAQKCPRSYGYVWYAVRAAPNPSAPPRQIRIIMHRVIAQRAGLPKSEEYDHRDRNGLNNVRSNIRMCDFSQNNANGRKRSGTSSYYKGVNWHKGSQMWYSRIQVNGNRMMLGKFQDETSAYEVYRAAAIHYFGEFACTEANPDKKKSVPPERTPKP